MRISLLFILFYFIIVVDNGEVIKVQFELVPALSDSHQPIVRPLIWLHEKKKYFDTHQSASI